MLILSENSTRKHIKIFRVLDLILDPKWVPNIVAFLVPVLKCSQLHLFLAESSSDGPLPFELALLNNS